MFKLTTGREKRIGKPDTTFPQPDGVVRNQIDAEFEFQDGKIIKHTETFDFWKWSSMALGPVELLLGWTPSLRRKVQKQAGERLARFIDS